MDHYDVIVIGGGPTGATVAGDLARAGRSVAVLERHAEPNPTSRAFAVMPRTLELLDARGLADALVAQGSRADQATVFASATLDLSVVHSRYPFALITPQTHVDAALSAYAVEQGADVVRGTEVIGLAQDDNGVTLTARHHHAEDGEGGEGGTTTWRAAYVVAADGAHSTVRDLLGVDFPGREVLSSIVLADVRLEHGPSGTGLTVASTQEEFGFLAPYGEGGWYRSMGWDRRHQVSDSEPVHEGEVRDIMRSVYGQDFGLAEIGWHSRFHCDERQVAAYRHGRVLLAGDAAHVHSPVGGQGMNTGIQDAVNLAWKLDAVLGGAPDAVLESYHGERHPIGHQVVQQSGAMLRAVIVHPRPVRWLRDRLVPRLLAVPAVRDYVVGRFTGTGLRYRPGRGEHRPVGTSAAAVPVVGEPLTTVQRDAGWVLVRAAGEPAVDTDLVQVERSDDGPVLLVRPDGYVAWAGEPGDPSGWREVLTRWTSRGQGAYAATASA